MNRTFAKLEHLCKAHSTLPLFQIDGSVSSRKVFRKQKVQERRKYLNLPLLLSCVMLLVIGCSTNRINEQRQIHQMVIQDSLRITYHVDKISYSPIDRTFFLLNRDDNTVRIYRNGVFFNRIGGSVFTDDGFRRLSDIALGIDGHLYALDSFDKSIKRFDRDGIFQGQMILNTLSAPERIAFTSHGSAFVYDGHSKEIFALDSFDFSIKFSFGKFQIDRADAFFIAGEYLSVFDRDKSDTTVFLTNGMLVNTFQGFSFYDPFRNLLNISGNVLTDVRTERSIYQKDTGFVRFNTERDLFIFWTNQNGFNQIRVYRVW